MVLNALNLLFYTDVLRCFVKTTSADKPETLWQKTPVANLLRHSQSGNYYARIRVRGKLIWKSLKTKKISVAQLRLGDFQKLLMVTLWHHYEAR